MTDPAIERAAELHFRIWREFYDLPGLRLTRDQAGRLWSGDPPAEVETALQDLVDIGVLRQIGPYFIRADLDRFSA